MLIRRAKRVRYERRVADLMNHLEQIRTPMRVYADGGD